MIDTAGSREAAEEQARETIPAGRLGDIADMGAAAAFLCSDQAGYITGHHAAGRRRAHGQRLLVGPRMRPRAPMV